MSQRGAQPPALSRRAMLQVGGLVAGGSVVGLGLVDATHQHAPAADDASLAPVSAAARDSGKHPSTTAPRSVPPQSQPPARPQKVHTWDKPISRLDAYVGRQVGMSVPRNAVMLTIDDGPDPEWTPKYLRLLARYHVRATFSLIGASVAAHPKLVRALVGDGHHLCNHTFTHPLNLPVMPKAHIEREIADTNDAIERASGFRPSQFRSPGGMWGPTVFEHAAKHAMVPLGWDVDPRDWALPGADYIRSTMLRARPHDIILCHDGGGNRSQTYAALQTVIPALIARGWDFITLPPTLV